MKRGLWEVSIIVITLFITLMIPNVVACECSVDNTLQDLTVTSEIIVNDYTTLNSDANLGESSIEVGSASSFSVGNEILIIQTQHSSNAGVYEFKKINSISGNTINLDQSLENSYISGAANQLVFEVTQVIRVPQYNDVTVNSGGKITSKDWKETSGGIVVFRAKGDVVVNSGGSIDVNGKGFRGSKGVGNKDGGQGEGYPGKGKGTVTSCFVNREGRQPNGNGGGGGGCDQASDNAIGGGGGAGHESNGNNGNVGLAGIGGLAVGDSDLDTIHLGGGGGSGGSPGGGPGGNGGNGAGAIIISAVSIEINSGGSIIANGNSGTNGAGNQFGTGGGGGGSGGTIYLSASDVTSSGLVQANGGSSGSGVSNEWSGGSGGSGSNGRIKQGQHTIGSSGVSQCVNGKFQQCNSCNIQNVGTDADGDGIDQQCEDSTCDNAAGVCNSAIGNCIVKTDSEVLCSDTLDNDCDGLLDGADNDCSVEEVIVPGCNVLSASWAESIATTNSIVTLIIEGSNECTGETPTLEVFEEDPIADDLVIPGPQTTSFNSTIESLWTVPSLGDGLFGGEAELYFTATQGLSSKRSELLTVIECGADDNDCDGVKDIIDQCPNTPLDKIKLVDNLGCAPGEASCVAEWDCSNAEWTECNEQGIRTRDISQCAYNGEDQLCESDYTPISRRRCITEEAFPIFTLSNFLITLSILSLFYIFTIKRKN